MESWEPYNYLTTLPTKWVELMNLSTVEWNMGWLPPHIVAIPDDLNDTYANSLPPGTFVIAKAGQTAIGDTSAETVVFVVCSVIALVWAIVWIGWSIKDESLLMPRPGAKSGSSSRSGVSRSLRSGQSSETRVGNGSEVGFGTRGGEFHAAEFEKRLSKYYPRVASYAEVYELGGNGLVEVDEVTGVSELLVRMFRNDSHIKALQKSGVGRDEMDKLRAESDAMLAEVHRRVNKWTVKGLDEGERMGLTEVKKALARHRPPRYRYREGSAWMQGEV